MKGFKAIDAAYNKNNLTLYIGISKLEFVPSYLYYLVESLELKNKIVIEHVTFEKTNETFDIIDLKGKKDWNEFR